MIDDIAAFAPECLTILTGGEPLLRRDILEIVRRAAERGLWVVVGTNGVRITENVAHAPRRGGSARPVALARCARCRSSRPLPAGARRLAQHGGRGGDPQQNRSALHRADDRGRAQLGELEAIADFAHERLAARVWNLYFLVPTGRGQFVSDITAAQYDAVLASLYRIQRKYDGRMLVNAKCAPHYIKTVLENVARSDPIQADGLRSGSPAGALAEAGLSAIRTYAGGAGGCPAGTHYMGIRPNGDVTPCPYLPVFAGTFATRASRSSGPRPSSSPASGVGRRSAGAAGPAR